MSRSGIASRRRLALPCALATLATLAALAALAAPAGAASADDPNGTATPLAVRLAPGERPGTLVFELTNTSAETLSVLRAGTPLEPTLSSDAFAIERTLKGRPAVERVPYAGRVVKRAAPTAADIVEIAPGGTLSRTLDLARFYAVPAADDYRVRFDGAIELGDSAGAGIRRRVRAAGTVRVGDLSTVRPASNAPTLPLVPSLLPRARPPAFASCDARQRNQLIEATSAAEGIAAEALSSLQELPPAQRPGSPRYERWFGDHAESRYERVTEGYSRILNSLSGATLSYDCSCSEAGVFAYVFPFELHDIYLCPAFFAAPVLGTDSRAGTLVHELSHFAALAGTDDEVYGQGPAAALAARDPALAVGNADNVEYFAENTPPLPMAADGGITSPAEPSNPTPVTPSTASGAVTLAVGETVTGSVAEDRSDLYRTSGADTVTLDSTRGDADLFVYGSPDLEPASLICVSAAANSPDVCELPSRSGTFHLVVEGFSDADYRLSASVTDTVAPPTATDASALAFGTSTDGRLVRGEGALFTAPAPSRLVLTSSGGDADLFVYSDASLSEASEICRSILETPVDACELPASGTVSVVVFGYTDVGFRLDVTGLDGTPVASGPQGIGGGAGDSSGGGGSIGWLWLFTGVLLLGGGCTGSGGTPPTNGTSGSTPAARAGGGNGGMGVVDGANGGSARVSGSMPAEPAAAATLVATLSVAEPRTAIDAPLIIRVTARNTGEKTVALLLWNTPLEPMLSADVFVVEREDESEPLAYRGRVVKRTLPAPPESFVELEPGGTLENDVDLARFYALDRPGRYTVRFEGRQVAADGSAAVLVGDGEAVVVERY